MVPLRIVLHLHYQAHFRVLPFYVGAFALFLHVGAFTGVLPPRCSS
jgi:hypothetical protein